MKAQGLSRGRKGQKPKKNHYFEINCKAENMMPTESEHVLKVDVKQTKKRKSDNIDKPGKKDVIRGINDQSILVSDF